jgi:hypothetical protein
MTQEQKEKLLDFWKLDTINMKNVDIVEAAPTAQEVENYRQLQTEAKEFSLGAEVGVWTDKHGKAIGSYREFIWEGKTNRVPVRYRKMGNNMVAPEFAKVYLVKKGTRKPALNLSGDAHPNFVLVQKEDEFRTIGSGTLESTVDATERMKTNQAILDAKSAKSAERDEALQLAAQMYAGMTIDKEALARQMLVERFGLSAETVATMTI